MSDRPSVLDSLFLLSETPETMMHVASMATFEPPDDAGPTYTRDVVDAARARGSVEPPWNKRLRHPRFLASPLQAWVTDEEPDLDYHVRRSALPTPGGERELGVLVSRLHSNPLDLSRPPWEVHVVEGLEGGRFAVYLKVHHSLVDGITATRLTARGMSTDPDERDKALFFQSPPPSSNGDGGGLASLGGLVRTLRVQGKSAAGLGKRIVDPWVRMDRHRDLVHAPQAPKTILNRRIGRNRRFATQQYPLDRIKEIGRANGATINDAMLSILAGGLRKFLSDLGELPDRPLVAFLPVNVRTEDETGPGNVVAAILASMATDVSNPLKRLHRIAASTKAAKDQISGLSREAVLAYSSYLMAPSGVQALSALTKVPTPLPCAFNVCVSNVPGPTEPLYLQGSRLEGFYPASIPVHGMALNITMMSYANTMNVGLVGCRDSLPSLQRLAVATGEAFEELDRIQA
ncbi:wax ester/triacylglycerol synthase family O-acyltransferase [Thermoleophilia bacterium SCSIO 60948]|nr:wax ester/triacylglycerol synthase family O-acyltransferase [Thermoleophilia bacterium SCSIO 60948]